MLIIAGLNIIGLMVMIMILSTLKQTISSQEVKVESVQVKHTALLPMNDPHRFEVKRLEGELIGFRLYVLTDNGLNEFYLFLESERGQLVGLGNLDDS